MFVLSRCCYLLVTENGAAWFDTRYVGYEHVMLTCGNLNARIAGDFDGAFDPERVLAQINRFRLD